MAAARLEGGSAGAAGISGVRSRSISHFAQATAVRRLARQDEGVVSVLIVLCMAAILGFVAIVTDAGVLYVNRTQLQKAVDAAALSGAYDIGSGGDSASDGLSIAAANGVAAGEITVNQSAATFSAGDSWTVAAQRSVPLAFARIFGLNQATVTAAATAISSPMKGLPGSNLMPYAIWGGNVPVNLGAGTTVTYRDNSWANANVLPSPGANPNWTTNSNDFKGFLRVISGSIYQVGSVITDGGNATGQEPIGDDGGTTTICDHVRLGTPGVFPVMGRGSGNGHVDLTVVGFVFVQMNPVRGCGGPQGMNNPFTGRVVAATTWNGQPGGSTNSSFPVARVLKLWQ